MCCVCEESYHPESQTGCFDNQDEIPDVEVLTKDNGMIPLRSDNGKYYVCPTCKNELEKGSPPKLSVYFWPIADSPEELETPIEMKRTNKIVSFWDNADYWTLGFVTLFPTGVGGFDNMNGKSSCISGSNIY